MISTGLKSFLVLFLMVHAVLNAQHTILENSPDGWNLKGCTKQNGSVRIKGDGKYEDHKASFNSETCLEEIDLVFNVEIISLDSSGAIQFAIGKQSKNAGTMVEFCKRANRSQLIVNRMDNKSIVQAAKILLPFQLRIAETYTIRIGKRVRNLQIEINSSDSYYYNDSLSYPSPFFGLMWGTPFIACKQGEIRIDEFVLSTPCSTKPKLAVWGDSYIEGSSLSSPDYRYVALIAKSIGVDNIVIMGRGGETSRTLSKRFAKELLWFSEAQFGLLAVGVNDDNFEVWRKEILKDVAEMRKKNIIPILATLSPRSDRFEFIKQANDWIRNTYQGAYIDVSKAIATDDVKWIPGMCLSDSIHSSVEGHRSIFNRVKMDAPFLLNSKNLFTIDYKKERTSEKLQAQFKYCNRRDEWNFYAGENKRIMVDPGSVLYIKDVASGNANSFIDIIAIPTRPEEPANDTTINEPGVFNWVFNPDFKSVSDYEFSIDNGKTWKGCTNKPIRNSRVAGVHIRVKATSRNFRSDAKFLTN
jgi:lysophospholipase L1-like esterase